MDIQRNDYVERLYAKTHYKSSALADDFFVKKYSKLLRNSEKSRTFAADLMKKNACTRKNFQQHRSNSFIIR